MNTSDTVVSLYRVIMINDREFIFSSPRFCCLPLYWLVRALHCLYRQRVIYWLMSEL